MSEATVKLEERVRQLETRVAELEGCGESPRTHPPRAKPLTPEQRAELGELWWRIVGSGRLISPEELQRMQVLEGADPDGTWGREEIERMREE